MAHRDDIENPKFEYRSTKQIQMTKIQMIEAFAQPVWHIGKLRLAP